MNRKEFGQLLASLRQDLGWTQFQLSEYSDVDDAIISQIERGVKKFFEPELLFKLANALQLTTLERREFFFAASGVVKNQMVRQPAAGTTTDAFHPGKIIDKLLGLLEKVQTPAFLNDVYGDVIATNTSILRFFNIPAALLEAVDKLPGGFNTMRMTFSSDMVGRSHVSDNWDAYAIDSMLTYRASTLRYRTDPYFQNLLQLFHDPVAYPFFDRYWKRVSSLERDKYMNSDSFDYHHEKYGHIQYMTAVVTTTTSYGELFLTSYLALDAHTAEVFSDLLRDGGNEVVRLAPWPQKNPI